ncbi:MAG: beta-lactamase family protein [Alphaproteobacteria bacterium]|nr:beta-lactamase family protein [Alphaproteobacteria bacterium]
MNHHDKSAKVDGLFAAWTKPGRPGAVIAVIQDGTVIHRGAYGLADIEHGIPLTAETRFRIASVTKQFLVTLVMLLAAEGKIELDEELRTYDPDIPDLGARVTVRHALSMNSGMRDFLDLMDFSGCALERPATDGDLRELMLAQRGLNFAPGDMFIYTNTGYRLVHGIIERRTGREVGELMRERIFDPLGMNATRLVGNWRDLVDGLATPHLTLPDGRFVRASLGITVYGEGGLVSTLEDLLKWERNLAAPRVGTPAMFAAMATPAPYNNGMPAMYGMGLVRRDYRGVIGVGHGGLLPGFRTDFTRYPEHGLTTVIITNADSLDPHETSRRVADIYLADRLAPVPPQPSEAAMAQHLGRYHDPDSGELLEIVWQEGGLAAKAYGNAFPLMPLGDGRFGYMHLVFDMHLRFRSAPGIIDADICGTATRFVRYDDWQPGAAELAAFAGTYHSDELRADFIVTPRDDGLGLRIQGELGRLDFRLEPRLDATFEAVPTSARGWYPFQPTLRFRRGRAGRAAAVEARSDRSKKLLARRRTAH